MKSFLIEHYGNDIQFSANNKKNESDMVFSAHITASEIARKVKHLDVVEKAGESLRQAMKEVDCGLDDRFCDADELQRSWETIVMPDVWLTLYASVYHIPKSKLLKIKMVQMPDDESDGNDSDDEDGAPPEKEIEWTVPNWNAQLHSEFQMTYYRMHHGQRTTPLHSMIGQSINNKTRSKGILTILNRIGVSRSYNEVRRARNVLCQYTIQSSEANGVPIPSHFSVDGWCMGALDNEDYDDMSLHC